MEHKGTVVIETERLILRPFNINDIEFAFNNWTNDEKVTEFLRWSTHKDISVTQKILKEWINSYTEKNYYQWAIELKEIAEPVGAISVVGMNEKIDMVQIGYAIGSKWWNKGITSEAFKAIIPFLFEEVKVQRIESQHDPNNPNSGKVMLKNGLTFEGIVDASIYSLLAEDYFNKKSEKKI
ncbi:MAG: GNAT family N-acetyltransferase [Fastidiosipilaceae bacterium]|jgi:ribosomal-protein-alanine N-acetyltransferase